MKDNFFLTHPVLAMVLSIVVFVVGCIGLRLLPVDQYPQIVPPAVRIGASYPGADALTVTQAVATPIEQQLNGTPGMLYMSSSSTNSGGFSALVTFDIGVDPELATVDIQNRLKKAEPRLPAEVIQNGLTCESAAINRLMTICVMSDDPKYDEVYLSNYTTMNVLDLLRRVPGVGSVSNVGSRYYGMQLWVSPDKLADLGLTVNDLKAALKDQNRESAAGVLGMAPMQGVDVSHPIIARGRLSSVSEFEDVVVRTAPDGSLIRMRDVARVSLESQSYSTESGIDGANAAVLNINLLPGANAVEVAEAVREEMDIIARSFPEGMRYAVPFDATTYIKESIHHVYRTFAEALLLVLLVVFLSLQDWRATLVPIIAVPISLVGTFGVMLVAGFSLNMLTLLGLILAIGIVVDDAIVVVENTDRIMRQEGCTASEAAKRAMHDLGSALVAMSLVLCAVFVPVSFLPGITGALYRQFTVTIAVSVVISTLVALTLSPVLCARLLRPRRTSGRGVWKPFRLINVWLGRGNRLYARAIHSALLNPRRMALGFGLGVIAIAGLHNVLPGSFMTEEDQGYFTLELELPEGATIERTRRVTERAMGLLLANPNVEHVLNVTGSSPRLGTNQAHAALTVILKPYGDRPDADARKIRADIKRALDRFPESKVYVFTPAIIPGLGESGGFEMMLEARGSTTYADLQQATDTFRHYARQEAALADISSSLQRDIPQLYFDVDRDRAQMLGIPVSDIFATMKAFTGSIYVNDFNMFNRIYRVYIQAEAAYRSNRDNLNLFFVRGKDRTMVPISALGTTRYTTGPGTVRRFNMFNSATLTGEASAGHSTGQAMEALERVAREHLPEGVGVEWSGLSYQQRHSAGNTLLVLGLAFLFVFLFLAAQYESWTVPLAVLLSLPVAGVGAYAAIALAGLENNVYFQIGLVMLVGLVAKNAILIVEFARAEVLSGSDATHAALTAARLRFRPLVMTSLAFMLGLLPLVLSSGPGSAARRDIATGVFGGMCVAITVGIVFVPFFFVAIDKVKRKLRGGVVTIRVPGKLRFGRRGVLTIALPLLLLMALPSCVVRKLPQPDLPQLHTQDTLTRADVNWWEQYGDSLLRRAVERTLAGNRDLRGARARIAQADNLYRAARGSLFPKVGMTIGGLDETNWYTVGKYTARDPEYDLKPNVSWEWNVAGAGVWQKRAASEARLTAASDGRALEMTLVARAATYYFTLVALDNELALAQRTLQTRTEAVEQVKMRFTGGLTSEMVYQQARVEMATTAALIPGLRQKITVAENALSVLMGELPGTRIPRADLFLYHDLGAPLPIPSDIPGDLLRRRPDLLAAESRLRAAADNVGVAFALRFPTLRLNAIGGWENGSAIGIFASPFSQSLIALTGPVFDFGSRKRRYLASRDAYAQACAAYEKAALGAYADVDNALKGYQRAQETIERRRELRDAARDYVDLARLQYNAGSIQYLSVLDAQRRYFDSEVGLSNAIRDGYIALVTLYKAI